MLLEQPQVCAWVAASFPIVLVDEGQDLKPERLRMLKALAGAVHALIAADEFQCLDQALRPNPLVAWLQQDAEPETLVQVRRTNAPGLLAAATAICAGNAPVNGAGFELLPPGASVPLAATLLANAIAWRQGGNVAVIHRRCKAGLPRRSSPGSAKGRAANITTGLTPSTGKAMTAMTPAYATQIERGKREILLMNLADRLPANVVAQKQLRHAVTGMLLNDDVDEICQDAFKISRLSFDDELSGISTSDQGELNAACQKRFGANCHAAGAMTADAGCLVVMRSEKEDDTSKPLLEAMRKAASQFSGDRPAFITVQFDDISPAELMLPNVRRRAGLLSYALFLHYGADHVNATCFSGFDGMVEHQGNVGTPSFCAPNREPKYPLGASEAPTFLRHISDQEFADVIGAPLPANNIYVHTVCRRLILD